jgi:hypothetical protein
MPMPGDMGPDSNSNWAAEHDVAVCFGEEDHGLSVVDPDAPVRSRSQSVQTQS